ncbi:MAG: hypothetical protein ACE5G7_03320 [Candidatus Hydrothermarchaeaceae archaeon]
MGIFVIIDAPNEDMEWALLKVQYAPEDFPADIAKESIHLSGYDPVADKWIRLGDAPEWTYSSGVDIDNNYAWANITRFGIFELMGGGMSVGRGFGAASPVGLAIDWRTIVFAAVFILTLFAFINALGR